MNRVYTYIVNHEYCAFSGRFVQSEALAALAARVECMLLMSRGNIIRHIAKHLWSMRKRGRMNLIYFQHDVVPLDGDDDVFIMNYLRVVQGPYRDEHIIFAHEPLNVPIPFDKYKVVLVKRPPVLPKRFASPLYESETDILLNFIKETDE